MREIGTPKIGSNITNLHTKRPRIYKASSENVLIFHRVRIFSIRDHSNNT